MRKRYGLGYVGLNIDLKKKKLKQPKNIGNAKKRARIGIPKAGHRNLIITNPHVAHN